MSQIKEFLEQGKRKQGPSGNEQKSNITDPESAKMTSSRGVIQGYNGLAVVDDRAQNVVHAEARGSGYEAHLLAPMLEATRETFGIIGSGKDILKKVKVTADSGFHSKAALAAVEQTGADAYIADRAYRRRDPSFATASRHKERARKELVLRRKKARASQPEQKPHLFTLKDFSYDEEKALCVCPADHKLYKSGNDMLFNGYRVAHFKAPISACRNCKLRPQCLRYPERTAQRQLTILKHRVGPSRPKSKKHTATERMHWKFDSPAGRAIYSRRMATVEPVFANLQNKGMRRFTLRGKKKVNAQWQLFSMVHNIEKIAGAARAN